MNKCFLLTWHAFSHHAQPFFFCGIIDVSAFSRPAAGVQTCASVWRGSVVQGLTWRSVGERKDNVVDSGVFYVFGHMSTYLSCRPDTCGCQTGNKAATPSKPCSFTLHPPQKNLPLPSPHLPLSGPSAQFVGNCADEDISEAATKHDPNLFHR